MAVLNPKLQRGSVSRRVAFTIAVLTLCVVFPLAAMRAAQQASAPTKPSPGTPATASTPNAAPEARPAAANTAGSDEASQGLYDKVQELMERAKEMRDQASKHAKAFDAVETAQIMATSALPGAAVS